MRPAFGLGFARAAVLAFAPRVRVARAGFSAFARDFAGAGVRATFFFGVGMREMVTPGPSCAGASRQTCDASTRSGAEVVLRQHAVPVRVELVEPTV